MNDKEKMYVAVIASLLGLLALTTSLHSREERKLHEQKSILNSQQIYEKKKAIYRDIPVTIGTPAPLDDFIFQIQSNKLVMKVSGIYSLTNLRPKTADVEVELWTADDKHWRAKWIEVGPTNLNQK